MLLHYSHNLDSVHLIIDLVANYISHGHHVNLKDFGRAHGRRHNVLFELSIQTIFLTP